MHQKSNLHWQILIALGLGVGAGLLFPESATIGAFRPYALFDFLAPCFCAP